MERLFRMLADWAASDAPGRLPTAIRQWMALHARVRADSATLAVAALAAVWVVAAGARLLRRALNTSAKAAEREPVWMRLAWSLIAAPVLGAAIVASLVLFTVTGQVLLGAARWFEVNQAALELWTWLRLPAGLLLATLVIIVVYQFAPSERQSFRRAIPGALLAALLWTALSLAFSFAISGVLRFSLTYGTFSAAMVLLIDMYLAAGVVLFGAEVNAVLTVERADDAER